MSYILYKQKSYNNILEEIEMIGRFFTPYDLIAAE